MICFVDLETTGLDTSMNDVLEVGAILVDDKTLNVRSRFEGVKTFSRIGGDVFALNMNRRLLDNQPLETFCPPIYPGGHYKCISESPELQFFYWLEANGVYKDNRVMLCGKNVASFDFQFLKRVDFHAEYLLHRQLDILGLFYPLIGPARLSECLEYADMPNVVTHKALEDAELCLALYTWFFANVEVKRK